MLIKLVKWTQNATKLRFFFSKLNGHYIHYENKSINFEKGCLTNTESFKYITWMREECHTLTTFVI